MPVPVPARSPVHVVNKVLPLDAPPPGLVKQSALRHLLHSLPEPPSGPPPAFTDRETWIKSLPPYRRFKVRQDVTSPDGNTFPVSVVEPHAEAAKSWPTMIFLPPPDTTIITTDVTMTGADAPTTPIIRVTHAPLSNGKPWPPSPPKSIKQAIKADERRKAVSGDPILTSGSGRDADDDLSEEWTEDEAFFAGPTVNRQASVRKVAISDDRVAISDDRKENLDSVATNAPQAAVNFDSDMDIPMAPFDGTLGAALAQAPNGDFPAIQPAHDPASVQPPIEPHDQSDVAPARKTLTPIPTTITPSDMMVYRKKIADPMSEWVAEYIWKVVTNGMSLPPEFLANETGYGNTIRAYSTQPPAYLADGIRTLLCSTLLQPSAIFLALWYIARMPVFFGIFAYDAKKQSKEFKFRLELLGEGSPDSGAERTRQLLEVHAPFRLLLLGVMLANKWLDDNTFSNKTWHQVSGIPMRALNRLESLGLDILSHDLSMLPRAWEQWLEHVQNYHRSLAPYPEPIGPPKDTPHNVIRRTIEELIAAGSPPSTTGVLPEPVFLGLEERKKERERERLAKEELDLQSLDLDEDGPLREEYVPKRFRELSGMKDRRSRDKILPPPAEWSPAADPPIHRTRPIYQAVQRPPPAPIPAHACAYVPEPASYVPQANGYTNTNNAAYPVAIAHNQVHAEGHAPGQGWPATEEFSHSAPINPHPRPLNYPSAYNIRYPGVVAVHHAASWSVPTHYAPLQPSVGSRYQPGAVFDAPPPSDLFRPTWLRT